MYPKSNISLHPCCHCPGLGDGLPLLVLEYQPSHWPPGSHSWSHTHCRRDLCKLSVRSHHSQLRPSTSYLPPMAPKASLVDTPLPPYPCLLPRPRLTMCQPSWSLSCHSNSRAHSYPRAFALAFSLPGWLFLHPHDLYPPFMQISAHMLPASLQRPFPITF